MGPGHFKNPEMVSSPGKVGMDVRSQKGGILLSPSATHQLETMDASGPDGGEGCHSSRVENDIAATQFAAPRQGMIDD
jgi:hypothetical protein